MTCAGGDASDALGAAAESARAEGRSTVAPSHRAAAHLLHPMVQPGARMHVSPWEVCAIRHHVTKKNQTADVRRQTIFSEL